MPLKHEARELLSLLAYVYLENNRPEKTAVVLNALLKSGHLHGDCMTITGKTIAETLADVPALRAISLMVILSRPPCSSACRPARNKASMVAPLRACWVGITPSICTALPAWCSASSTALRRRRT